MVCSECLLCFASRRPKHGLQRLLSSPLSPKWRTDMRRTYLFTLILLALLCATCLSVKASARDSIVLVGTAAKWRYPDAELNQTSMSDASLFDAQEKRTRSASLLKTTFTTGDSVDKVLAFYRELLTRNPTNDEKLEIGPQNGRSVVFNDESEGRPFAFHTIVVNTADTSTTLIITRHNDENLTHITWKHYVKFAPIE